MDTMKTLPVLLALCLFACAHAHARSLKQTVIYSPQQGQQFLQVVQPTSAAYSQVVTALPGQVVYVQQPTQVQYAVPSAPAPSSSQTQPTPSAPSYSQTQSTTPDASGTGADASSQGNSGDAISDPVLKTVLDMHNSFRLKHQVGTLAWSSQLQASAQDWANRCVFQHSGPGENLAQYFNDFPSAVQAWFNEEKDYKWDGQFSYQTGHFTEAIWKQSSQLGCGYAPSCSLYVCHYSPVGNVIGHFNENVFPPTS